MTKPSAAISTKAPQSAIRNLFQLTVAVLVRGLPFPLKYICFSSSPFTANTAIDAHERAWEFIAGIPVTLVYDQDRVFMVNENCGDLILTDAFKHYSKERGFRLHFCRKSDPESKGKVDNMVRYVKQNFLYNSPFVWIFRTILYQLFHSIVYHRFQSKVYQLQAVSENDFSPKFTT